MVNKSPAIEIGHLRVVRGQRVVLPDLNLAIGAGKVTGLLGPSGSGKSTLIRAIVGVQVIASGEVRVFGEAAGSPSLRSRVGYVSQAPSVYPDLTVRANVAYFGALTGQPAQAVDQALFDVDLSEQATQLVEHLSGGQLSRVSLACALVGNPDLLVLDEPTVGLDPVLRRDLWELFHRLADAGRTLLVSSHVMDEATRCDELVLLREGVVLAHCTPADLLTQTHTSDAEAAFLALIDRAGQTGEVAS